MDQKSKEAIKSNLPKSEIAFDLETTGFGLGKKGLFSKPVDIWQLAYTSKDKSESIYASVSVPFEKGTLKLFDKIEKGIPAIYGQSSKIHEKEMLTKFGQLLTDNPDAVLTGYNISRYDIPLLAKKFKQYGLEKEFNALKNMKVNDVLGKSYNFLDTVLSKQAKRAFGLDFKRNVKAGARLEVMAKAFGIDMSKAPGGNGYMPHNAQHDIWLTQQLDSILSNHDEAKRLYSIHRHAQAFDQSTGASIKKGLALPKDQAGNVQGFHSWTAAIKKLENKGPVELTRDIPLKNPHKLTSVKDILKSRPIFKYKPKTDAKQETSVLKEISKEVKTELNKIKISDLGKQSDKLISETKKILKSPTGKKAIKYGAIGVAGYAAYSILKNMLSSSLPKDQYISATSLGKDEEFTTKMVMSSKNVAEFNKRMDKDSSSAEQSRLLAGDYVHKIVEAEFEENLDTKSEVAVYDKELGIKGSIDVLAEKDGVKFPIELKSTTSENLAMMDAPLKEHESQVNFYAHTQNAPGGYITYVSKDNTDERKTFYVPYSPGKLIADVAAFRSVVIQNRDTPGVLDAWGKQMEDFFEDSIPEPQMTQNFDFNMQNKSKIRDQATRNSHLFPIGTPKNDGNTYNGTRYMPRN